MSVCDVGHTPWHEMQNCVSFCSADRPCACSWDTSGTVKVLADMHAIQLSGHGHLQAFGYHRQEVGPFCALCTPKEPPWRVCSSTTSLPGQSGQGRQGLNHCHHKHGHLHTWFCSNMRRSVACLWMKECSLLLDLSLDHAFCSRHIMWEVLVNVLSVYYMAEVYTVCGWLLRFSSSCTIILRHANLHSCWMLLWPYTCRISDVHAEVLIVSRDVLCYGPVVQKHVDTREILSSLVFKKLFWYLHHLLGYQKTSARVPRKKECNKWWIS